MSVEWVRMRLDLASWPRALWWRGVEEVRAHGVDVRSLAELGDTPAHRRALYDLNAACAADMPDRTAFFSEAEYRRTRLEVPEFRAAGVHLAVDRADGAWLGLTMTSHHGTHAFTQMTGTRAGSRRRGVALALKAVNLAAVRDWSGLDHVRTVVHPANTGMLALNRRVGFVVDGALPAPPVPSQE